MSSVGPIEKTRDNIKSVLSIILNEFANASTPSVNLVDQSFTTCNIEHPMLYKDLLPAWVPVAVFPSKHIVADGFQYPTLPHVPVPQPVDPRRAALAEQTRYLIASITQYLTSEWTNRYRQLIMTYVVWRNAVISPSEMLAQCRERALKSDGVVKDLVSYFHAWLTPSRIETDRPLNWAQASAVITDAETVGEIVKAVHDYVMTDMAWVLKRNKNLREQPMPLNGFQLKHALHEFLDEFDVPPSAVAYIGDDCTTLAVEMLQHFPNEYQERTQIVAPVMLPNKPNIINIDVRKNTLMVNTAPLNIWSLYLSVYHTLPTLVFYKD